MEGNYIMADESRSQSRSWTTFWDRPNRRVLLLAGAKTGDHWWGFVKHDTAESIPGVYDIWRTGEGDVVVVEVRLDAGDKPLGFPRHLASESLLGIDDDLAISGHAVVYLVAWLMVIGN